jgi:Zn-dependent protease with chaperone function
VTAKPTSIARYIRGIDTPIYELEQQSIRWSINSATSPSRTSPVRWLAWTLNTDDHFSALPAGNNIRHSRVFGLALALGAGGLGLTATAVVAAALSVHHESAGAPQLALAGIRFTYPSLNGSAALLLILALLGTAVLKVALKSTWRQRRAYRAFTAHVGPVEPLRRVHGVNVITDSRPQAFCAGFLRPSVYVSHRTVDLLTDAQLDAVLAHEQHHRRLRDPLRLACGRILSEALFFIPVLKSLVAREADVAELRADHAAVCAREGGEAALASALLAFDESGPAGSTGISPERVDALLGQRSQWRLPAWRLAASLLILAALTLLVWRVTRIASAHASFNLPGFASRPCIAVMTLLPVAGGIRTLARWARRGARRSSPVLRRI